MSDNLLIIDGDLLAYRCCAATEKRSVLATHKETLDQVEFDTATLFKEWAGVEATNYDLLPQQNPEPIQNTFYGMNQMIKSLVEKAKCKSYHIVLSGENCWRKELPLPSQYKANRAGVAKPLNLKEAKQYLVDRHKAEIAPDEADEKLAAYKYQAYKNKWYQPIATIDKDDISIPGWTFNWLEMEQPEFIDGLGELYINDKDTVKGKGRLFLYFQMVVGDIADHFKPSEIAKAKFGEKSGFKLLSKCTTDKEAVEAIVKQYRKWYPEPVWYQAWDGKKYQKNWIEIWQMYADCSFMPRWDGDRLDVKKLCEKLGVNV